MTDVQVTQRPSRRALLAGALGGIGAVIAGAVSHANPAHAEGEAMVVGGDYNDATSATILSNSTNTATVLLAQSTANGIGVYGYSSTNTAVRAESVSGHGVLATSSSGTAVGGSSTNGNGVVGVSTSQSGVQGTTSTYQGVYGIATSTGNGVLGQSDTGVGVYGYTNGTDEAAIRSRNPGNGAGLVAASGNETPIAPTHTGIYGFAQQDGASRGVWGNSPAGHGIHGESDTGWAGYFDGRVFTNKYLEMPEIANPSSPGINRARLFVRDNGSGHTQLCVKFHNGTIRVLATA